jgi:hypothetical protein
MSQHRLVSSPESRKNEVWLPGIRRNACREAKQTGRAAVGRMKLSCYWVVQHRAIEVTWAAGSSLGTPLKDCDMAAGAVGSGEGHVMNP